ncbi:MAG: DUF2949 domain-containing protein [Prochloraceae cyanobacterium]|nr:DUF2949 domain-containing protein [Prochloraceae cyanobacterium]
MSSATYARFINFLEEELDLSSESISILEKSVQKNPGPLPMILWQYGLITLEQLDLIYDWLEKV